MNVSFGFTTNSMRCEIPFRCCANDEIKWYKKRHKHKNTRTHSSNSSKSFVTGIEFIVHRENRQLTCVALIWWNDCLCCCCFQVTKAHIFYFNFIGMLIWIIVSSWPSFRLRGCVWTQWNFMFLCGVLMSQFWHKYTHSNSNKSEWRK